MQRTRDGGAEIVKYLKTGSAYYAPSAAVTEMVEAILKDKKKILPCAAYSMANMASRACYVGVPVKLGAKGIEQIIEIKLTPAEKAALDKSADSVKELVGSDRSLRAGNAEKSRLDRAGFSISSISLAKRVRFLPIAPLRLSSDGLAAARHIRDFLHHVVAFDDFAENSVLAGKPFVGATVMKNCEPLVFGPEFAIASFPGLSKRCG